MKEKIFKKQKISAFLATFLLVIGVTATCVFANVFTKQTETVSIKVFQLSATSNAIVENRKIYIWGQNSGASGMELYLIVQSKSTAGGTWRKEDSYCRTLRKGGNTSYTMTPAAGTPARNYRIKLNPVGATSMGCMGSASISNQGYYKF